jgi:hypothetical protein
MYISAAQKNRKYNDYGRPEETVNTKLTLDAILAFKEQLSEPHSECSAAGVCNKKHHIMNNKLYECTHSSR